LIETLCIKKLTKPLKFGTIGEEAETIITESLFVCLLVNLKENVLKNS